MKVRLARPQSVVIAMLGISAACGASGATPKVAPLDRVEITLERSACFGSCPVYKVAIYGNGRVHFAAPAATVDRAGAVHKKFAMADGVLLPGSHEDRIRPEAVARLVKQFENAHFWRLKKEYRYPVSDAPSYRLTFDNGRQRKSVVDYVGDHQGMPTSVTALENAVDRLAGTDRWVTGTAALIPWLEQSRFDFHSSNAAELAVAGEWGSAAESTVSALIERGAPLDKTVTLGGSTPMFTVDRSETAGIILIEAAIRRGHATIFKQLVADGWLNRVGKTRAAEIFAREAAGCSPRMVDAVADAGVDIDRAAPRNADSDPTEPQGKSALGELAGSHGCQDNEARRVRTAERLLSRGADPNHRDSLGQTPLYGVENLDLLNLLLSHGADAKVKSNDGQSMVFGSWTDAIVLRLLEAGASPLGRYDIDGNKTLVQETASRKMPQVSRWLAAHPEAFRR